jgi:hypothetical protein
MRDDLLGWSITHDAGEDVFRVCMPEHISTPVARASLTALVHMLKNEERPSVLIVDLRAVRRIDPKAAIVGATLVASALDRIEHAYILTDNPGVRVVATSAATSIGLRFSCQSQEPDLRRAGDLAVG